MAPTEGDRVTEACMLLRQALRLLDDDVPCTDRRVLTDLAADLAAEAVVTLRGSSDVGSPPATALGPGPAR